MMGSRSTGYNNEAYWQQYDAGAPEEIHVDHGGDVVQYYQSYNETFVDDEQDGQSVRSDYEQLRVDDGARLNESFTAERSPRRRLSASFSISDPRSNYESFTLNDCPRNKMNDVFSTRNDPRNRLDSLSVNSDRRNFNDLFSTTIDHRSRLNEPFSIRNDPRNRMNESLPTNNDQRSRLNEPISIRNDPRNRMNESLPTNNDQRSRLNEPFSIRNDPRNRMNESLPTNNDQRSRLNEPFSIRNDPRNRMNESLPTNNDQRSRLNEPFSIRNDPRNRLNESLPTNNDQRSRFTESLPTNNDQRSRLNESLPSNNDQRSRLNETLSTRSRRNESSSVSNSPRKTTRKERSSSAPGRRSTMEVFAPMISQCQDFPAIRRSRSTVRLPREANTVSPTLQRRPTRSDSTKTVYAYPQSPRYATTRSFGATTPQRPMVPNIVSVRSERLHSFDTYSGQEMVETSLLSPELKRRVTPVRKPSSNLAIIPPNCRNKSAMPLLASSPSKFQTRDDDFGDRSPTKGSWLHLPSQHGRPESLWLAGMVLLITGFAICVLCFFLLSKKRKGHDFFLELGAVSGFVSFVLGFLGFRTNSYSGDWLPNRNYMSGYIILILLNLLQCVVLSILSSGWKDTRSPEEDIAYGAIGGLAVLTLLLAVLGVGTSMCCRNPPPDNRVAHCAQGFIV